jgi:hypothetical protein
MAKYPRDYEENLRYRNELREQISGDPQFAKTAWELCKRDILYWFNCFCWTHDPRKQPSMLPFITYRFQDIIIKEMQKNIDEQKDMLIEKSRDMGMTWILSLVFQHYWLFGGSGNDFLIGSRTEDLIDKIGALDTIFEKLRYNLYRQPNEFLPYKYDIIRHDTFCKMINPENGSYIRGESNKYFGTSGRYKAVLFDEFSKWEHTDETCWQACSDASPCKIAVSSANGRNNMFYRLRSGQAGKIKVHSIHWRLHPEKDTRWYAREKKRRSKQDLAAEVDLDYLASIGKRVAENWLYDKHVGFCRRVLELPLELNCDFNVDPMFWTVSQTLKGIRYTIAEIVEETTITESVINKFIDMYKDHYKKLVYIYGDASGKFASTRSRWSDYDIIKQVLKQNGWSYEMRVPKANPDHRDRINAINKRLSDYEKDGFSWELVSKDCKRLIESIEMAELNEQGGLKKNGVEHGFDAFTYGTSWEYPIMGQQRVVQYKRSGGQMQGA